MTSRGFRYAILAPLLMICAGCASVSVDSPAYRQAERTSVRPYRFRVAFIDGPIADSGRGVRSFSATPAEENGVTPEKVNRVLSEVRPDLYDSEGIPVSIRVESTIPTAFSSYFGLMSFLFYSKNESSGIVSVRIYEEDGVTGRKAECPATITYRVGMFPFARMVSNRRNRPTWKISPYSQLSEMKHVLSDVHPRLVAFALADVFDVMSPEEIESLSRSVRLTRTELSRRKTLEKRSVETIHLADTAGTNAAPSIVEHRYQVAEQESKASHPRVLKQEYSSGTYTGMVLADVSGFSEEAAGEWLLCRLIPKICETKATVVTLDELTSAEAQFVVTSDKTDENNVRTIQFRQIQ